MTVIPVITKNEAGTQRRSTQDTGSRSVIKMRGMTIKLRNSESSR